MKVICSSNRGYKWSNKEGVFFKGFIFDESRNVLKAEEAIGYFSSIASFDDFTNRLASIEGCFSIIINKEDETWAAVDIERTMPIYYSIDLDIIADDAEIIRKNKKIPKRDISTMGCLEMYGAIYVSYENTTYDQIKQIDYRNAICIKNNKVDTTIYYSDRTPIKKWDREAALKEMRTKYENAVKRALGIVGDRTIILSLSGGYDSRCLACTLKNLGFNKVVCLAYGDRNSFEIGVSKKVADALGYPWHCIEYSAEDQLSILKDKEFIDYATEHDYTIYLQNYVAIKKAKEQRIIPSPEESVFMVGLINDVTVGHYTPTEEEARSYGLNDDGLAEFIVRDGFARFELREDVDKYYHKLVMDSINKYGTHVHDYQSFVTAWDDLNLGRGHSRNYPKMNMIHEFFGYEWVMPLMDRELMSFWRSIPVEMRQNHNLFAEFVTERLASEYGVGQKKIEILNAKTPLGNRLKRWMGGYATRILYPLGIPLKRKADINNFAPLEVALYKRIKQKRAIKPTRAGIRHLMDVYFMERRYGYDWYKKIKGMIK